MSTIQMYINNEEVLSDREFAINEEFLNISNLILNNVYPKSWEIDKDYISRFYYPKDYSSFKLLRDGELYFSGYVKNSGEISLNPRYPKYATLQILDYKMLLSEGKSLDFVISNKTISEAITKVVNEISDYGFIVGNINILNDTVIGAYSTLDKTAYDVLQYLSEISQSRWFTRIIDENTRAIDFYDASLIPSAGDIEYSTNYFTTNKIVDMTWNYGTRDYRNKQYIISDKIYSNITSSETIVADGYQSIFITDYPIGYINSIMVNGVLRTFATNTQKSDGIYADFYYTPNENSFNSNSDIEIFTSGTSILIEYTPYVQGREFISDFDEIQRISGQTGVNGEIVRYESRNDISNSEDLQKIAETYIQYKGTAEIILQIITEDLDLFNIGQQVYFNIDLEELKTNYLLKSKQTKIIQTGEQTKIFYTYKFTSNFNTETAINFFDNQRRKKYGNIEDGDSILRNIDLPIVDTTVNFYNATTSEVGEGNNLLECGLECLLIS